MAAVRHEVAVGPHAFAVPVLQDNWAWVVVGHDASAVVVDPGEAGPVQRALARRGLSLRAVLATHHHHDHVGGVLALVAGTPGCPVLAGSYDVARCRVPGATTALADGEATRLAGHEVHALAVAGHTLGAVAYHLPRAGLLFTGDTLFLAGCGRLFEGDAPTMWRSLLRLRALPEATRVCCGHDYLAKNLRFAAEVLPGDDARAPEPLPDEAAHGAVQAWASLGRERRRNPFLRADDDVVQRAVGTRDAEATFAELRRRRDTFA